MGGELGGEGGVGGQELGQFVLGPVEDGDREGAGEGGAVGAQFGAEAVDLGAEFGGVVGAEGPEAVRVVEFVEGDRGLVEAVGELVAGVVVGAEQAADAVAAEEERAYLAGRVGGVADEEFGGVGEDGVGALQLVVGLQGLGDDDPRLGERGAARRTPSTMARASASWPYSQRLAAFRARTRTGCSAGRASRRS